MTVTKHLRSTVLPGALLSSALERLLIAVRALFSLCAPVRLLERLFHTCARVWRDFFIQVIIQKICIIVRQIVSQSDIFSLFGVSLVKNV